ncbi:hypothetical protein K4F52_004142 [Lecanicillium sp. MT-2017a]|nr:hypothetical protein K4F52_004142 [Lecanicillium sp. MT-2017a]
MSQAKDDITCHVLDTTAGRPAKGVPVRLEGPLNGGAVTTQAFTSTTDADGRIKNWVSADGSTGGLAGVLGQTSGATRWRLTFDTESYFGEGKTFFPEAVVVFRVERGQHYHVPLLLSPFTFTTYRGS